MSETKLIVIPGYDSHEGKLTFLNVPKTLNYHDELREWSDWCRVFFGREFMNMVVTPPEPEKPKYLNFQDWLVEKKGATPNNSVEVW